VMCLAVPIFGWFFGLPLVLGFGMAAAACWFAVLSMILVAWACTAFTIAAIELVRRRRAAR
jgi:hypothetical protein